MNKHQGIEVRHSRSCTSRGSGSCDCKPTFQASIWNRREQRPIKKTFSTLAEARGWRRDALYELGKGIRQSPSKMTLREAANEWLLGVRAGTVRTRSGDTYKPSAIRSYESSLNLRILDEFGGAKLSEIRRVDLQGLADQMLGQGLDPSTIRNTFMPVRAIFRRAVARGEVAVNPTSGLELPAVRGLRDRIASPEEAAALLAALPREHRPLWAVAFYAGLRAGEIQALTWENVDLGASLIRVEKAWDQKEGVLIEPKSRAGRRAVPIIARLHDYLSEHKLRVEKAEGYVFGRPDGSPLNYWTVAGRAKRIWKKAQLTGITLHECRHTFASLLIAAGVNAKGVTTYMGHSSVTVAFDLYGHLFPGNEGEAAELLNAYLERADTTARLAQLEVRDGCATVDAQPERSIAVVSGEEETVSGGRPLTANPHG